MLRKILVQTEIIILVSGLSLNWLMTPIMAAEATQPQIASISEIAKTAAEQHFIHQQVLPADKLIQQGELFQTEYQARWQSIQAEFDCGTAYCKQMQAKVNLDELTQTKSSFFVMGVKWELENNKDNPEEHLDQAVITDKTPKPEPQSRRLPVQSMNASKIPHRDAEVLIPRRETQRPPANVAPVIKGFSGGVVIPGHQQFIQRFAKTAQIVAQEHNLYASVMIAQAVLESSWGTSGLSQAPFYNLFGVKGTFAGKSVAMKTNEDDGQGHLYTISDRFRYYPSYRASLEDYAMVMLQPVFRQAWKSNTTSYEDATAALTGTYATDTNYATKLNQIIVTYDLTQYDQISDRLVQPRPLSQTLNQQDVVKSSQAAAKLPKTSKKVSNIPTIIGWGGLGLSGWWLRRRG